MIPGLGNNKSLVVIPMRYSTSIWSKTNPIAKMSSGRCGCPCGKWLDLEISKRCNSKYSLSPWEIQTGNQSRVEDVFHECDCVPLAVNIYKTPHIVLPDSTLTFPVKFQCTYQTEQNRKANQAVQGQEMNPGSMIECGIQDVRAKAENQKDRNQAERPNGQYKCNHWCSRHRSKFLPVSYTLVRKGIKADSTAYPWQHNFHKRSHHPISGLRESLSHHKKRFPSGWRANRHRILMRANDFWKNWHKSCPKFVGFQVGIPW